MVHFTDRATINGVQADICNEGGRVASEIRLEIEPGWVVTVSDWKGPEEVAHLPGVTEELLLGYLAGMAVQESKKQPASQYAWMADAVKKLGGATFRVERVK